MYPCNPKIEYLCKEASCAAKYARYIINDGKKVIGVNTLTDTFKGDNVVIATGGMGYPVLGAEGDGYPMAESVGHKVTDLYPAMMPLKTKETWVENCRADTIAKVTMYVDMKKYKNIYLIGLMGSGKTTLGKILSKKLDKTFFDSDQVIEEKLGVDVPMIFEYEGEAGFREREKEILKELVSKKNIILATGGGVILSKFNRDLLSENGIVIYLKSNQKD